MIPSILITYDLIEFKIVFFLLLAFDWQILAIFLFIIQISIKHT